MVNPELIITGILVLCCCFCCCISIIGIYFIEESDDDDDDKGSCIRPTDDAYNFNGITENLKIDKFNVSGITCAQGYSGENISTAVCSSSGTAYIVRGCSLDPSNDNDGNSSEVNAGNGSEVNSDIPFCNSTFPTDNSGVTYIVIEGGNFANYLQGLKEINNEDINCSIIGTNGVSCSGTLNSSGSIDCSGNSSGNGTISCNSSGVFILDGCLNASVGSAETGSHTDDTGLGETGVNSESDDTDVNPCMISQSLSNASDISCVPRDRSEIDNNYVRLNSQSVGTTGEIQGQFCNTVGTYLFGTVGGGGSDTTSLHTGTLLYNTDTHPQDLDRVQQTYNRGCGKYFDFYHNTDGSNKISFYQYCCKAAPQ